jgi:hypothetical protein
LIERRLLAKKQILGNQRNSRTKTRASETQSIDRQVARNAEYKEKQSEEIHQSIIKTSTSAVDHPRAVWTETTCYFIVYVIFADHRRRSYGSISWGRRANADESSIQHW